MNYPGLESHPQYERAQRLFAGAGGVLSFELHGGVASAGRLLSGLTLPATAPSLGGVETLVTRPAATSHSGMTPGRSSGTGDHRWPGPGGVRHRGHRGSVRRLRECVRRTVESMQTT